MKYGDECLLVLAVANAKFWNYPDSTVILLDSSDNNKSLLN